MPARPEILIISQVLPFPGSAGQQNRVAYKLRALRKNFRLVFLTIAPANQHDSILPKLLEHCDEAIILPAIYPENKIARAWRHLEGLWFTVKTGLKFSNYLVGELEFSPRRVAKAVEGRSFTLVFFEYWHAHKSISIFQERQIPCVLDMHNILWQSYERQLRSSSWVPAVWRRIAVKKYKEQEENAWGEFDTLIAINRAECDYVVDRYPEQRVFYIPMGTDLDRWPYSWKPVLAPRIVYYGGLGSVHNQRDALICLREIMPRIWAAFPNAELWIVGSNPPAAIRRLADCPRVNVTGFVDEIQDLLSTMSLALCPWTGTYGFRSRLIELMALGVPVVASHEAVYGMDLDHGQGLWKSRNADRMAEISLELLKSNEKLLAQSRMARNQVEARYSFETTYQLLGEIVNQIRVK